MKRKGQILTLLCGMLLSAGATLSQYTGGSADGFVSSRSDDILYEGSAPITTDAELPDVVNNLTINNPAGVTLSKSIIVNGIFRILSGDFDLNGNTVAFGENADLRETPGNTIIGVGGNASVTRALNDLTTKRNVAGLGLTLKTNAPLGTTTIERGHAQQQLTPDKMSASRFFDVMPTNNSNLDATVDFHYDESQLNGIPEADLALFISHDAVLAEQNPGIKTNPGAGQQILAAPTWQFLGGTTNAQANTTSKGGVGDFSRLTIARAFVFLAGNEVKIEDNVISEGDIHSNGTINFEDGEPGTHTGNLTAVGDIEIDEDNTIVGDAIAGGNLDLSGHATVTGTATANATVAAIGLPSPSFSAGGTDVTVPEKRSLTLAPGSYGNVKVKNRGTLFLTTGDYFMNKLELEHAGILSIDVASGPVNINVVTALEFEERTEVVITPSGQASTNQVTFTTLQQDTVDIGDESLILGWIIAPQAEVHFDEDCRFKGSVVAEAITVDDEVIFVSHSSALLLSKASPAARDAETADKSTDVVTSYELSQNYPNPFNPSTTIQFSLKEAGTVQLSIYNLQGQEVRALVSAPMNPGQHAINWDGKDNRGQFVPSGIYLYKLSVNGFVQTKKMSLVK
ncbi:MAG: FlgD immunoglobulin-like domain containing protein [bacterium]